MANDPNSINSRVVANIDVKARGEEYAQSIVYDDGEGWGAGELGVLHITGVPVVPFSKVGQAFRQLMMALRGFRSRRCAGAMIQL